MYLSDKQLQNGDHILVNDVGLENDNGLVCWVNRKIFTRHFGWHYKPRVHLANESKIEKNNDTGGRTTGWYSDSWLNVVPHVALTRRSDTPATECVLTCKDQTCDICSSVSLEVHYPSGSCVSSLFILYNNQ